MAPNTEAIQLFLNDQLVNITADAPIIKRLNDDDNFLADYINKAAKMGQFHFLFKDNCVKRIVVRRAPASNVCQPVWCKKGNSPELDSAATTLLLRLRGSDTYMARFKQKPCGKLWDEIANDMKMSGFDVDGSKCCQKFNTLKQGYYKHRQDLELQEMYPRPEFSTELEQILGKTSGANSDDEEWLPKNKKRKKEDNEIDWRKYLKERNELMREKLKQNQQIINLLEKLVNK